MTSTFATLTGGRTSLALGAQRRPLQNTTFVQKLEQAGYSSPGNSLPWPNRRRDGLCSNKRPRLRGFDMTAVMSEYEETPNGYRDMQHKVWVHPAGTVALPRTVNESLPRVTTCLGTHSAQTIGQNNPPGYPCFPNIFCRNCKGEVDKNKTYGTHLFENTQMECIVLFEIADDPFTDNIQGEPANTGDPLIKIIVPIVEKVKGASTLSVVKAIRNPSYCVDCLNEEHAFQPLFAALLDHPAIKNNDAHLVRLREKRGHHVMAATGLSPNRQRFVPLTQKEVSLGKYGRLNFRPVGWSDPWEKAAEPYKPSNPAPSSPPLAPVPPQTARASPSPAIPQTARGTPMPPPLPRPPMQPQTARTMPLLQPPPRRPPPMLRNGTPMSRNGTPISRGPGMSKILSQAPVLVTPRRFIDARSTPRGVRPASGNSNRG